jgi:hypothetical protein
MGAVQRIDDLTVRKI